MWNRTSGWTSCISYIILYLISSDESCTCSSGFDIAVLPHGRHTRTSTAWSVFHVTSVSKTMSQTFDGTAANIKSNSNFCNSLSPLENSQCSCPFQIRQPHHYVSISNLTISHTGTHWDLMLIVFIGCCTDTSHHFIYPNITVTLDCTPTIPFISIVAYRITILLPVIWNRVAQTDLQLLFLTPTSFKVTQHCGP